jgi:hypothetical protein
MDRETQLKFLHELSERVVEEIQLKIESGKIPEQWDGFELRTYMAECFQRQTDRFLLTGKRKREYTNIVIVKNL